MYGLATDIDLYKEFPLLRTLPNGHVFISKNKIFVSKKNGDFNDRSTWIAMNGGSIPDAKSVVIIRHSLSVSKSNNLNISSFMLISKKGSLIIDTGFTEGHCSIFYNNGYFETGAHYIFNLFSIDFLVQNGTFKLRSNQNLNLIKRALFFNSFTGTGNNLSLYTADIYSNSSLRFLTFNNTTIYSNKFPEYITEFGNVIVPNTTYVVLRSIIFNYFKVYQKSMKLICAENDLAITFRDYCNCSARMFAFGNNRVNCDFQNGIRVLNFNDEIIGESGTGEFMFSTNHQTVSRNNGLVNTLIATYNCIIKVNNIILSMLATLTIRFYKKIIATTSTSELYISNSNVYYYAQEEPMQFGILSINNSSWRYNRIGDQEIKGTTYYDLEFGGSGEKKLMGDVTVTNNYTLSGTATVNLNGFTLTVP